MLPLHHIFLSTLVQVGEFEAKLFTGEVSVMQVISHPCIVRLLGVCTRELPSLLVMEYIHAKGESIEVPAGARWEEFEGHDSGVHSAASCECNGILGINGYCSQVCVYKWYITYSN